MQLLAPLALANTAKLLVLLAVQESHASRPEWHNLQGQAKLEVGLKACEDVPGWVDSDDLSCHEYVHRSYCTSSGDYGEGWLPFWGKFEDYANNSHDATTACCGCGRQANLIQLSGSAQLLSDQAAEPPARAGWTLAEAAGALNEDPQAGTFTRKSAMLTERSTVEADHTRRSEVERRGSASSLPQWGDAQWTDSCWGTPDPEQQLSGDILKSICARLHQNASFLVFGLGRDSKLWYNNSVSKNIVFLENHDDWLQFQDEDVRKATRIVKYSSDAARYQQELLDENKLAELFLSLPKDIADADWDMILVDSPMGMETKNTAGFFASAMSMFGLTKRLHPVAGTPGRTQSIYAAKRLARQHTIVYVDDVHRAVEETATQELLRSPDFQTLKVFSSGHRDNNGIMGKTAMLERA